MATLKDSQITQNDYWTLGSASTSVYLEGSFTASESYSLTQIELNLFKIGSPTFDITYYLYSDSSEAAGSLLATGSATLSVSTVTEAAWAYYSFSISSYNLVSGTKYHHVLKSSTYQDYSNCIILGVNSAVTNQEVSRSANGTTWTVLDPSAQVNFKNYTEGTPAISITSISDTTINDGQSNVILLGSNF
jgi:hypothetical protein